MSDEISIVVRADDQFSSVLSDFGNIMTGIKSTIDLVADAFHAVYDAVAPFVQSAAESELVTTELEAIIRATGSAAGVTSQQMQDLANQLQGVTRYSDETILNGVNLLLTFRNISGETLERTVPAMLDMAEIFGSVDSAAMQLGKALNDPVNMMGALSRAGVTFSEAQKEAIKAFVETNQLAEAQNIILTEVEKQVGNVSEAVGNTFTGQLEIAKNKLDEVRETIGNAFLPVLKDLLFEFMNFVETNPIIQGVLSFFDRLAEALNSDSGFTYIESLAFAFSSLRDLSPVFLDLAGALSAFQIALDRGLSPLDAFQKALENLSFSESVLGQVAGYVLELSNAFETGGWSGVWEVLKQSIIDAWAIVSPAIDQFFANMFSAMEEKINVWVASGGVDRVSNALLNALTGTFKNPTFQTAAGEALLSLLNVLGEVFKSFWNNPDLWAASDAAVTSALKNLGTAIMDALADIFIGIIDFVIHPLSADDKSRLAQEGGDWAKSIWQGFINGLNSVEVNITNWVRDHIVTPIKEFLGIASPSTLFFSIGRDIVLGLVNGIGSMLSAGLSVLQSIIDILLAPIQPILDLLGIDIGGSVSNVTSGYSLGGGLASSGTGTLTGTGTVNNYFYGPVYFGDMGQLGYDCPSPHPLLQASQGSLLHTINVG